MVQCLSCHRFRHGSFELLQPISEAPTDRSTRLGRRRVVSHPQILKGPTTDSLGLGSGFHMFSLISGRTLQFPGRTLQFPGRTLQLGEEDDLRMGLHPQTRDCDSSLCNVESTRPVRLSPAAAATDRSRSGFERRGSTGTGATQVGRRRWNLREGEAFQVRYSPHSGI